jgi:hypothetical protein
MRIVGRPAAAFAAAALLCACRGEASVTQAVAPLTSAAPAAQAAPPSLLWQQAGRNTVLSQVSAVAGILLWAADGNDPRPL